MEFFSREMDFPSITHCRNAVNKLWGRKFEEIMRYLRGQNVAVERCESDVIGQMFVLVLIGLICLILYLVLSKVLEKLMLVPSAVSLMMQGVTDQVGASLKRFQKPNF